VSTATWFVSYLNLTKTISSNQFRDIFTAFRDGKVCAATRHLILNYVRKNHANIDAIVGLDARGFLFSFMIAAEMEISCVPIRKRGKLPGETQKVEYALEYGTDVFEVQSDSIKAGQRVVIIDDLLATGGSLKAANELIKKCGGIVEECIVIMELSSLNGRKNLDVPVFSFIQYADD
jgi:adenine phosphoribosyltransferase